MKLTAYLSIFCLLFASGLAAQTTVALAPDVHPQFLDSGGRPLANGFLFTYTAGTNVLSNTYLDFAGTIQNPDPIPLDSSGAPTNGSQQVQIWLANLSYKFCAYNSGMVQQWCADNVTGYLGLLNLANTWTFQQTFSQPIVITATDNQIVLGAPGNQSTLDAPPPVGDITLHFPNTADTLVGRATTDTLSNKDLTLPTFNATACPVANGPATYICLTNQNPTGTTTSTLTKITNSPSQAQISSTTDSAGIIGICVSACGNTGSAVVQQSGTADCIFDNAVVANDYVQSSTTVNGNCHDSGTPASSRPPAGALGIVTQTGGAGTYPIELMTGLSSGGLVCSDGSQNTVNANTTSFQIMKTCQFAPGSLNTLNRGFRLRGFSQITPAGATTNTFYWGSGPTTSLGGYSIIVAEVASATPMAEFYEIDCIVRVTGAVGKLACQGSVATNVASASPVMTTGLLTVDLTGPFAIGTACSFSAGSTSNFCSDQHFTVDQF